MRGDLDLPFHQCLPPLSEGNLVDLDFGVALCFSLFFLSNPSLELVALVGFGSEGLDHRVALTFAFGA